MRKFALIPFIVGLCGVVSAQAQVRDLFAEFEEETAKAESSSAALSSSAVQTPSSSISSAVESSSSVAVSSSSEAVALSSSIVASSSSAIPTSSVNAAPADSLKAVPADSATAPVVAGASTGDSSAVALPDSATQVAAPDSAIKAQPDSAIAVSDSVAKPDSAAAVQDSLSQSSSSAVSSSSETPSSSSVQVAEPVVIPSSSSMSRRDLLGPVKVSKVNGIDEMKGRYKSPRKALFMSLVIPGSGQLYVGGSTFTYVRGGVYLALEAALWGSWYYFSVYKYDDQVDKYKKFAKNHFSIGKYEVSMRNLYKQLADETEESRFETRYMSSRESFCEALYGTASSYGCYVKGQLFTNDKNHLNKFSDQELLGKEVASLNDVYDMSVIYQNIADKSYVLGWDDVTDVVVSSSNLNLESDDDNGNPVSLGSSANLQRYRSMRSKANDYADMQAWFFGGLILNHIVSAVDAALTANAHNKALYSEDVSWMDRMHLDSYMSFANGFDAGVQASWGF